MELLRSHCGYHTAGFIPGNVAIKSVTPTPSGRWEEMFPVQQGSMYEACLFEVSWAGQLWGYILVTLELEWLVSKLISTIYYHGDGTQFPGQANTATLIVPLAPTNPYAHALVPAVVLHSGGVAGFQTNIHKGYHSLLWRRHSRKREVPRVG